MAMPDEQPLSNEAVRGWLLGLQQSICDAVGAEDGTPFLTDDEVDRILKGADYWIDSDDISRRLSRRPAAAKTRKPAAKKTKVTVSAKG